MRVVIQRVSMASVKCSSGHQDKMKTGMLVFLGIEENDGRDDIEWLSGKICRLRIFDDKDGIMNLGVTEVGGDIMIISQFTLHASTRKGNRPSYIRAALPVISEPVYEAFLEQLEKDSGTKIKRGVFGDEMEVQLLNAGPVTILIDTKNKE